MPSPAETIYERIQHLRATSRQQPLLVAFDGPGGSGKSTIARQVSELLTASGCQTSILEADDLYRVMLDADRAVLSPAEGYEQYFDWQQLEAGLTQLRAGQDFTYEPYNWDAAEAAPAKVQVKAEGVVLVDGVYSLRRQLRDLYDLRVMVSTPRELRQSRQDARGENDPAWIERWMAAEDFYVGRLAPHNSADLIVRGS